MAAEVGLTMNPSKCEIAVLAADDNTETEVVQQFNIIAPGIKHLTSSDATLLGAPLADAGIEIVLDQKTSELEVLGERLTALSAHSAFFLLRASISIPRLIYFLRCAPTWKKSSNLSTYDLVLKSSLEKILNCSLTTSAWAQSALPVKMGGLGIRHSVDSAIPCFLASIHSVQPLVKKLLPNFLHTADYVIQEAEELWETSSGCVQPPVLQKSTQKSWEEPVVKATINKLQNDAPTTEDRARYLAVQQQEVGSWLNALLSPQLGTHLTNESFRISCALRLGCEICQAHECPCGAEVTNKGYHGLACKRSSGRRSRHEAANDVIARALRSAEVPNIREPAGCSRQNGKRPDGMTLIP